MKYAVVFAALVAVVLAAPVDDSKNAQIVRYDSENIGVDGYNFGFETSDGIARQESAQLNNIGTDNEALSVRGSYSYIGPDQITYTVNFLADENGFQPEGAHLPQP